jgi:hypothetical protein
MPAFINTPSHSAYEQIRRNDINLCLVSFTEIHAAKTKAIVEIMGHKHSEDRERNVE